MSTRGRVNRTACQSGGGTAGAVGERVESVLVNSVYELSD
jgi:hypothetical protein